LKEEEEEAKRLEEEEKTKKAAEAKKAGKKVSIDAPETSRPASPKKGKKKGKKKKKAEAPVIPPVPWPMDERFENMPLLLDEKKSVACLTTADLNTNFEVYAKTNWIPEVFSAISP